MDKVYFQYLIFSYVYLTFENIFFWFNAGESRKLSFEMRIGTKSNENSKFVP